MFDLKGHETTAGREIVAGLTTFAAMAYILAVNPAILAEAGMDRAALVTATAIAAAVGSLLMALLTNYPIALAPGMGLNAFFTYGICLGLNVPWQGALAMVFWNGVLFVVLSVTPVRTMVVRAIPESLKIGIQAGIGLFIAIIGLKSAGIVVADPNTLFTLGALSDGAVPNEATLALIGIVVTVVLMALRVPGAILLAILGTASLGLVVPAENGTVTARPETFVAMPASLGPLFLGVDWLYPFRHWETAWVVVLTLLFVDLFDSIGTLIGVSRQAKLTDEKGELPRMDRALLADATATTLGACVGSSPVTSYIESATGVQAGGRTGLTVVVVALCFLAALLFHPLILAIPAAATTPALVIVGTMMMTSLARMDWDEMRETVPGVATAILIPLSYRIADGIALGCILYTLVMLGTGQWRRVHWLLAVLSVLFALKFAFASE